MTYFLPSSSTTGPALVAGRVDGGEVELGGTLLATGASFLGEVDPSTGAWAWVRSVMTAPADVPGLQRWAAGHGAALGVLPFENSLTLDDQVLTSRGASDLALWRLDYCP